MSAEGRLLRSKRSRALVLVACALEVVLSARALGRPASSLRDAVHIYGLAVSILLSGALALRCRLTGERLLFGAMCVAVLLLTGLVAWLPAQPTVAVVRWAILAAWAVSTVAAASILLPPRRREE